MVATALAGKLAMVALYSDEGSSPQTLRTSALFALAMTWRVCAAWRGSNASRAVNHSGVCGFGKNGMNCSIECDGKIGRTGTRTSARGAAEFVYDPETRTVKWVVTYSGLSGPATMAHFHGPATQGTKGPLVVWLSKQGSPADSPLILAAKA